MKQVRFHRVLPLAFLVIAFVGLASAQAQGEGAEGAGGEEIKTNYFSQFFGSDTVIGAVVIWFLVLNSIVLMSIIIQAALQNRKLHYAPEDLIANVEQLLKAKDYRAAVAAASAHPSVLGQVLDHAMQRARQGYDAMEQAVWEMAEQIGSQRVRGLVWMEVAGAAGPMMGLFGTVYGMIVAFTQLVALGGNPKPAELAGGIATALVCTFWGLVVGIPGVISAAVYRVRIESMIARTIWIGTELLTPFRSATPSALPPARSPGAPGAGPGPGAADDKSGPRPVPAMA